MASDQGGSSFSKIAAAILCLVLLAGGYWAFDGFSSAPSSGDDSGPSNRPASPTPAEQEGMARAAKLAQAAGVPITSSNTADLHLLEAAPPPEAPASTPDDSAGPPGDSYAAGQRALAQREYLQRKSGLMERVARAEQASRCGVIPKMEVDTISIQGMNIISQEDTMAGRSDYHPDLIRDLRAIALKVANEVDQNRGLCSYWQQNPEAVAEIREEGQLSLSPTP